MFISYHICDKCGKKVTNNQDVFYLEIKGIYEDKRGVIFELCRECANEAKDFYEIQREAVLDEQKTA